VQVKDGIKQKIQDARFIAVSCDEVTTVDHLSYVSIHAYIMENWTRIPLLIACKQVRGGATANNLTKVILAALEEAGGMDKIANRTKLISFGADGMSVFQGCRTGVATQLRMKHAPFLISVHCFAHRLNLAYKSLSSMGVMPGIEGLLSSTYGYFAHSPKKILEFQNLAEEMDSKGLKLLRNVQTRWISLLDPLRRVLSQYRGVMGEMVQDKESDAKAKVSLSNLMKLLINCLSDTSLVLNCQLYLVIPYCFVCLSELLGADVGPLHSFRDGCYHPSH
jgi:hypothetical protein